MTAGRSVIIVGGGAIGLCAAYYAMQAGLDVTVLERGAPDHDSCSLGNAGMVVPSHFVPLAAPGMVGYGLRMMMRRDSPFYVRPRLSRDLLRWGLLFQRSANASHVARSAPVLAALHLASRACYEELADRFGNEFGLNKRGLLMLCKEEQTLEHEGELVEQAVALGVQARILSARQTAELDPGVTMEIAGSVYFSLDCHLNPSRFVAMLTRELTADGAKICWNEDVSGWRASAGGKIDAVITSQGERSADEYVLAAGAWSPAAARDLSLDIPMQAGKGYSITVSKPVQLPEVCSLLIEARVAVTPMGESLRFGGTMEITGLDETISRRRVQGILNSIPRYFPAFDGENYGDLPVWRGPRPCSPDGLPYIGRAAGYQNLSVATGHAMMGISLAPITGKIITSILCGEKPALDIELLRTDRF